MVGEICMSGKVIGARVKFEVNHGIYEGEVKMLSDGSMTAVGDFKPVHPGFCVDASAVEDVSKLMQPNLYRNSEIPPGTTSQAQAAVGEEAAIIPIRHSWKCFWAEKSGSKEILEPVWLDIGVVSVATAYHPKCGKVTFMAKSVTADGDMSAGVSVETFNKTLNWMTRSWGSLRIAKAAIDAEWGLYCKEHKPTIKPEPEWQQVKSVWVCEHNGWAACLRPSTTVSNNGENHIQLYVCEAWRTDDMRKKTMSGPRTLHDAKCFILGLGLSG